MPTPLSLIAAVARNGAIGRNNRLLVHLPGDLPRFRRLTATHPMIMGRRTWDSIGRPLPGRRSIVVTRNTAWNATGAEAASSFDEALAMVDGATCAFVIGGGEIFALALPVADELLLTEIDADFDGDAFFPAWPRAGFECVANETHETPQGLAYRYATYHRAKGD